MMSRIRWCVRRTVGALCNVIEPHYDSYEQFLIDDKYVRTAWANLEHMKEGAKKGDTVNVPRQFPKPKK